MLEYLQSIFDSDEAKGVMLTFFILFCLYIINYGNNYYNKRKYDHFKEMAIRIIEKDNEDHLESDCHGGRVFSSKDKLESLVLDMKKAYYEKDWELVGLIVLRIYKILRCKPIPPKILPLSNRFPIKNIISRKGNWDSNRAAKKHYTSSKVIAKQIHEMFIFHAKSDKTLKPNEFESTVLNELNKGKKSFNKLVDKHDKLYQKFKEATYYNRTSLISMGYELEQKRATDEFYGEKFFKYNENFSIACKNFLKCSKDDISSTMFYWTGNQAKVITPILSDNIKNVEEE